MGPVHQPFSNWIWKNMFVLLVNNRWQESESVNVRTYSPQVFFLLANVVEKLKTWFACAGPWSGHGVLQKHMHFAV